MVAVAQRLQRAGGIKIEEFPQTVPNLTAATQNLYDLIQSRAIVLYPDQAMRLAISRAIMHESSRGWRLDKLKQHHKIDLIVALSMAALVAVRGQGESSYDCPPFIGITARGVAITSDGYGGAGDAVAEERAAAERFLNARLAAHIAQYGGVRGF